MADNPRNTSNPYTKPAENRAQRTGPTKPPKKLGGQTNSEPARKKKAGAVGR